MGEDSFEDKRTESTSTEANYVDSIPQLKHTNRRHLRSTSGYYEAQHNSDSSTWTTNDRRHSHYNKMSSHHRRRRKGLLLF